MTAVIPANRIRRGRVAVAVAAAVVLVAAVLVLIISPWEDQPDGSDGAAAGADVVALSHLDGATTPGSFTLVVDTPGATSAKLVVDGAYVGEDATVPLEFAVSVGAGEHRVRVRSVADDDEQRIDARFTAEGGQGEPTPAASGAPPSSSDGTGAASVARPRDLSRPIPPTGPVTATAGTVAELEKALAGAEPGDVIELEPGRYVRDGGDRWVAAADGTAERPITLLGTRDAVIASDGPGGDYGLHVTGDHWVVRGLVVEQASKGIVLDGSDGTVLDDVEVREVGDEGVHFRWCSSDGILRDSYIHDTGLDSPQFGEGVYVGSANSNWPKYSCTDGKDNSERTVIEGNTFEDITAEGADLKEGTESGMLRGNVFINVGHSGENSADSAVDAKGNGWLIEGNTVRGASGEFLDGFQAHSVISGYGTGNSFTGNTVEGRIPGFGIGLYPAAGNVVTCSNTAPDAALGLVGANSQPTDCTR
jgi:hypothetical protein